MPKEGKDPSKKASSVMKHAPLDRQIKETRINAEGTFSRADGRKVNRVSRGNHVFGPTSPLFAHAE